MLIRQHVDMSKRINIKNQPVFIDSLDLFNALSDKTRQEIIGLFYIKKEANVTEIARHFSLSRPTISHHLNLMKRVKILKSRKDGKEIYYYFNKEYVVNLLETLLKFLKGCC
jgi:DNA-binding transcriptional ArsR family regulator